MNEVYNITKATCLSLSAVAGLIAGLRIFQRWNRGDEVESGMVLWFTGILMANGLVILIDKLIVGGGYSYWGAINYTAEGLAIETHQAALMVGVIIAIVGIIKVYQKFQTGDDDLYVYMVKWVCSILFLFTMGSLISAML